MHRVCSMLSGGKDSMYALHWAVFHGFHVCCIASVRPRGWDSMLFHYPSVDIVPLQAKALGIPLISLSIGDDEYSGLVELFKMCKAQGAEGVVAGALLSDYQRLRFAMAALEAGMNIYAPLWRKSQEEYLRGLVREGFRVLVVSVQAYGLPESLVGSVLTPELVEEIVARARRYGFNPAFEGGEAETLVLDAPLFRYSIEVAGSVERLGPYHYVYKITSARLIPKPLINTLNYVEEEAPEPELSN